MTEQLTPIEIIKRYHQLGIANKLAALQPQYEAMTSKIAIIELVRAELVAAMRRHTELFKHVGIPIKFSWDVPTPSYDIRNMDDRKLEIIRDKKLVYKELVKYRAEHEAYIEALGHFTYEEIIDMEI